MLSSQDFYSIISSEQTTESNANPAALPDYKPLLEYVQQTLAENHAVELAELETGDNSAKVSETMWRLVQKYVIKYMEGRDYDRNALTERVYRDMAEYGLLTGYLSDTSVEEININGYDQIEVTFGGGITKYLTGEDAFLSPDAALNIIKRMVKKGGFLLDAKAPQVDSYIGGGTRISAMIPPLVPEDRGVVASIRKQSKSYISSEQLVANGTATTDMLDFLTICLCNHVSVGIAGSTGSGKTTTQAWLVNRYIENNDDINNRIVLIEDSREIVLLTEDEIHKRPARVLNFLTKEGENPVSMLDHTKNSLRFHPNLIVPAEVRDAAAWEAVVAGQTGHTILTSFHADSAVGGYERLVSMCLQARTGLDNEDILKMCVECWPVIAHQRQLKDGKRRITEIYEATGTDGVNVTGNKLFEFDVENTIRDKNGKVVAVKGQHKKVGSISAKLGQRLIENGANKDTLLRIFPELRGCIF